MTQIQRHQFWTAIHRYLGLTIMTFLLIASVTGVALSFTAALDAALNRDLLHRPNAFPLDPVRAVTALGATRPDLVVTAMPVLGTSNRTLLLGVTARLGASPLGYDQVFVDRSDGHIRGTRQRGPGWDRRHLMEGVFQFHYTLLAGTGGRWVMGLAALGWLIGNLVGVYLTLPLRGAFWKQWRKCWQVTPSSPLPRLLLDIHRASALWLLGGVVVLAFTSVCMNFFEEAFSPAVRAVSPGRPSLFDTAAPAAPPSAPMVNPVRALATAARAGRRLDWRPAKVGYLPEWGVYRVLFTDDGIENYHRLGPVSLYVDGTTGRVLEYDDPYGDGAGRKLSRALYPLHTGKMLGRAGIALDIVLGLATIEMIGTGLYLWLKRRRLRVKTRRTQRARRLVPS